MTKSEKTGENYQDRQHHSLALRQQEQYIGQLRIGPGAQPSGCAPGPKCGALFFG